MPPSIKEQVYTQGFALIPEIIDPETLVRLRTAADLALQHPAARSRRGSGYGLRNIFQTMPESKSLASSHGVLDCVMGILGPAARPVKGILFDKTEQANWAVPWHQDLTIATKERHPLPGYEAWSEKDGVPHVQPPSEILQQILAVRIHLDPCPVENGALQVIPGSHTQGRLTDLQIERWRQTTPLVICSANAGDALLIFPLLLHSSAASLNPVHRRVLHIEYTRAELPGGLEWSE
jgi:hypothetical protein